MPNYVMNLLEFDGDKKRIAEMLKAIRFDNKYLSCKVNTFDFNKMIQMPEEIQNSDAWYDWSVDNWGTKWNSFGYDGFNPETNEPPNDILMFCTAWSAPHPVIEVLAQKYPDIEIFHTWADECIGSNSGRRHYCHGGYDEFIPDTDDEAIEIGEELWGISEEDD